MSNPKKAKRGLRNLFTYHRYLGLAVAVFTIILSITGIMLNHTEALRLDERSVGQSWLLSLYGIPEPEPGSAFVVEGQWVSEFGEQIFLQTHPLQSLFKSKLTGVAAFQDILVIATPGKLALFTLEAEFVDEIISGDSASIAALGIAHNNQVVVKTNTGKLYSIDQDFTELNPLEQISDVDWIQSRALPDQLLLELKQGFRGEGLPLERVVLDLHSGRLMGRFGIYLMDSAALLLLILTLTGLGIWISRVRRRAARSS